MEHHTKSQHGLVAVEKGNAKSHLMLKPRQAAGL
jgi:hypothetical protein